MSEANLFNTAGVRIDGKCAIEDMCTDESQHFAAPSQRHHCQPGYTGAVLIHADGTKSLVCERRWMTMRDDELDNNAWPELALARDKVSELLAGKSTTPVTDLAVALDIALFRLEVLYVERDRLLERVEALEANGRRR